MQIGKRVELKNFSSIKIGGSARDFVSADNAGELIDALRAARQVKLPVFVLGGGTNILWSDHEFYGVVIRPLIADVEVKGNRIFAGAGVLVSDLVYTSITYGLAGLEWAGGLPGSFGGAIFGNAGCFGGEIKDLVEEVVSLDMDTLKLKRRDCENCKFMYRWSVFKSDDTREIILGATLKLKPGDKRYLYESVQSKIRYREERQPLDQPNIGSIFKNVKVDGLSDELVSPHREAIKIDPFPVIPAAHLIDKANLKGAGVGGAIVSPKHSAFIVNTGNALSSDVIELMDHIKSKVYSDFGIELEEEIRIVEV